MWKSASLGGDDFLVNSYSQK